MAISLDNKPIHADNWSRRLNQLPIAKTQARLARSKRKCENASFFKTHQTEFFQLERGKQLIKHNPHDDENK